MKNNRKNRKKLKMDPYGIHYDLHVDHFNIPRFFQRSNVKYRRKALRRIKKKKLHYNDNQFTAWGSRIGDCDTMSNIVNLDNIDTCPTC